MTTFHLAAVTLCVLLALPCPAARGDDSEQRATKLRELLKQKDAAGVGKFFDQLDARARRDFVKAFTEKPSLDEALDKLLKTLKQSFAKGDEWDDESAIPYELFLHHVVKGMKKEWPLVATRQLELIDYQDYVIFRWLSLADEVSADPYATPQLRAGKARAIRQFLVPLGIRSAADLAHYIESGEPKPFAEWTRRYNAAFGHVGDVTFHLQRMILADAGK